MRHAFAVAPRSYALHGRGDKVTASSEVFQLSFNYGLHHNSAHSQTTAPAALLVGSDAKRILAQFHIQSMTQGIDYKYIMKILSSIQTEAIQSYITPESVSDLSQRLQIHLSNGAGGFWPK
jgi:hypothetical protein